MSWDMKKEPTLQTEADKMIPRYVLNNTFMVKFPDKVNGRMSFSQRGTGGLIRYMEWYRTNEGTGAGVCGCGTRKRLSFKPWEMHHCIPGRSTRCVKKKPNFCYKVFIAHFTTF
jgi:hypothetical protein